MSKQHVASLLSTFGKSVGLPELAMDETGMCTLSFDDYAVNIHFDEAGSNLILFAPVGTLPSSASGAREQALADLMEANLFWAGTGGGTLGLDPSADDVVLQRQSKADLEQGSFEDLLKQFVDLTEYWAEKVEAFGTGNGDGGGEAPLDPSGMRV